MTIFNNKFICDGCIVDPSCQTPCEAFIEYIETRLLGVYSYNIPNDFVCTEQRYFRSINSTHGRYTENASKLWNARNQLMIKKSMKGI
jgi:hypothetical protein